MMIINNASGPSLADDLWDLAQTTSKFLGRTFTQTEGIDKCLKSVMAWGDFLTYFLANETYTAINGQFKTLTSMFGALNSLNRIKEWVLTEERVKFINSAKKTAIKVLLTAANFLESIKYLETVKLIELGVVSSYKLALPVIQRVIDFSPITVIKDLAVVVASVITLSDADVALANGRNDDRKAGIDHYKSRKWDVKNTVANLIAGANGHQAAAIQLLNANGNVSKEEYIHCRMEIERRINAVPSTRAQLELDWNNFLNNPASLAHALNDGERLSRFWKIAESVHSNSWSKAVISIANDLGKIAIITTALVGLTILGLKMAAFMIPFLALGVVVGSLGYVKFLFDDWYKQKETTLNTTQVGNLNAQRLNQKY